MYPSSTGVVGSEETALHNQRFQMAANAEGLDSPEWVADRVVFSAATDTLLHASEDTDAAFLRKSISWRIMDLEHEIRALKSRRNEISSIFRLPQETLSEIFLILAEDAYYDNDWINITFVCRHWRTVALECRALWTTLPILNAAFTDAVYPRTENASLSLTINEYEHPINEYLPLLHKVLAQIGRVESLRLNLGLGEWHLQDAFSKCADSALLLRHLTITFSPFVEPGKSQPLTALKKIHMPSLEHLKLVYCGARWDDIQFSPSLRTINLKTNMDAHRPTLSQLMIMLKETQLVDVTLSGFLPLCDHIFESITPSTLPESIKLQELTQLSLVDKAITINQFLQLVQLPQVHMVQLVLEEPIQDPHEVDRVLSSLRGSWHNDSWTPLKCGVVKLHIAGPGGGRDGRQGWHFTIGCPSPDDSSFTVSLMVSFQGRGEMQTPFHKFSRQLNLASVTSLRFDEVSVLPSDWRASYGMLNNVREITIQRRSGRLFELMAVLSNDPALSDADSGPSDNLPSSPLFPFLKELRLGSMGLSQNLGLSLAAMLRKRADAHYSIPVVKFVKVKGCAREKVRDAFRTVPETDFITMEG